ncbi:hypothetical protein AAC387_Pa03g3763 [Persea americana]
MTTLQRSSVSFRRQGSSGLIWNDQMWDSKGPLPVSNAHNRQENHHSKEMIPKPAAMSPTTTQQRTQKCGFSTVFSSCCIRASAA